MIPVKPWIYTWIEQFFESNTDSYMQHFFKLSAHWISLVSSKTEWPRWRALHWELCMFYCVHVFGSIRPLATNKALHENGLGPFDRECHTPGHCVTTSFLRRMPPSQELFDIFTYSPVKVYVYGLVAKKFHEKTSLARKISFPSSVVIDRIR